MSQPSGRPIPARRLRGCLLLAGHVVSIAMGMPHEAVAQQPLAVTNSAALAFGRLAAGTGGGVTISAGGVRTASGGVVLLSAGTGSPAQFTLTGEPNAVYSIGLPADGSVLLSSSSGHTMPVQSFSSTPNGAGQLSPGGTQMISVGATLGVAAGQRVGNYSGSFQVFLNYN